MREHVDEIAALWERRDLLIDDPDWDLSDLAEHEARVAAHLKGVRASSETAAEIATSMLDEDDAYDVFAGAYALLALGGSGSLPTDALADTLASHLEEASSSAATGVRLALRHAHTSIELENALRARLDDAAVGEGARSALLDVFAFRRRLHGGDPIDLRDWEDPAAIVNGLSAIARLRQPFSVDALGWALEVGGDIAVAAIGPAIASQTPDLHTTLRGRITAAPEDAEGLVEFVGIVGGDGDVPFLDECTRQEDLAEAALGALAALGTRSALDCILAALDRTETLHAAGRAFLDVTGASDLDPEVAVPPPDTLAEDEVDFWDEWPPVDPGRARVWWSQHASAFSAGRWQAGVAIPEHGLPMQFATLPLAARRRVYLRALHRSGPDLPDVELEATATVQRNMLDAAPA